MSHPNYDKGVNVTTMEEAQTECSKFITSFVNYANLFSYLSNFDKLVDAISKLGTPPDRFMRDTMEGIMKMCREVIKPVRLKLDADVKSLEKNYAEATISINKKAVANNAPLLEKEAETLNTNIELYNKVKDKLKGLGVGVSASAGGGGGSSAAKGGGGSAPRRSTRRKQRKQRKQRKTRRH